MQPQPQEHVGVRGGPQVMGYGGGAANNLSYNQQSFGMAFRSESKEIENQVNKFGFRGATSAAIDRTTEDRIAIGAADVYAAGSDLGFGKVGKSGPKAEPKKTREKVRRKTEEGEEKPNDIGGSRRSHSGERELAPPREKSKSPEMFAEAKAPPPSPVPSSREAPPPPAAFQRGLSLELPGAAGSDNGIYVATAGGIGSPPGVLSRKEKVRKRELLIMRPVTTSNSFASLFAGCEYFQARGEE